MDRSLNIFFDLDETLVQSLKYSYLKKSVASKGLVAVRVDRYLTVLRSIALDMLAYARMRGDVFILTQGGSEYFFEINNKLNLGFNYLNAYTYEDIYYADGGCFPIIQGKKNILIDNLTFEQQVDFPNVLRGYGSKISFLDNLSPERYFCIPEFDWKIPFDKEQDTLMEVQVWIDKFVE